MYYNATTGQLQGNPPWDGYLSSAMIAELYADWTQVADGFVPPTPAPTQQQQYAAVNIQYATKLSGILTAISQAQARGITATVTTLQTTYNTTQAAWKSALQAVNTSTSTTSTTT